ncbi:hypothetical protein [Hydrogenophaga atypica]|uniref:Uncharacterized protein n=1 Tax=Hydrogenophaga atypica TaxID=249409 RepID=A0ABW2QH22_9BURK
MNEKFVAQLIAELQATQAQAIGLLTQALCRQLDAKKLKRDLEGISRAYEQSAQASRLVLVVLQNAQAAAHAEAVLQANDQAGGAHPSHS